MNWLITLLIAILMAAAIGVMYLNKRRRAKVGDEPWPFYPLKPLSEPEQILYHRLVKALPECIVLAQVQLSRVLGVKNGANFTVWNNRINQKSLDFVVCLKDSTVVAVVELDDGTHERASRQKTDANKNKALASAGVNIVRWNVKALPDEGAIRAAFTS